MPRHLATIEIMDVKRVVNPNEPQRQELTDSCVLRVRAGIVSLNGGVVLAIAILVSTLTVASIISGQAAWSQAALFGVLAVASWIYLIDSVSETLELHEDAIRKTSRFSRHLTLPLSDIKTLLLRHEGLNQQIGIESLTVEYQDGNTERIALGPCWRRRDLERFLETIEERMQYGESVRLEE